MLSLQEPQKGKPSKKKKRMIMLKRKLESSFRIIYIVSQRNMASICPTRTWRVWNHFDHSEEKQKPFPEVISTSLIIFLTSIKLLLTGQMSLLEIRMAHPYRSTKDLYGPGNNDS